jgi:TatD DNase family protein
MFIDTHTHLYDEQFDHDRESVIEKSIAAGVGKMFLPNCENGHNIAFP